MTFWPAAWVEIPGAILVGACLVAQVPTLRYARRAYLGLLSGGERNGSLMYASCLWWIEAVLFAAQMMSVGASVLRLIDWQDWPPNPLAPYHLFGYARVGMSLLITVACRLSYSACRRLRDAQH